MSRPRISIARNDLRSLVKQLEAALQSGIDKSDSRVQSLVLRIGRLVEMLRGYLKARELRRMLGATAVLLGIGVTGQLHGQGFAPAVSNPAGLPTNLDVSIPTFGDLDGDGDFDMLTGELDYSGYYYTGSFYYYENTGTATSPQFTSSVENPFNISTDTLASDILVPALADIDGDGDLDIIAGGSGFYGLVLLENIGTAQSPDFAMPVANPFGLNDTTYLASPVLVDLDDDGDLDIITSGYYGNFSYFENTGSATAPTFAGSQVNPFGLTQAYAFAFATAGDVDWDGDMDLIVGEYYGDVLYYENTGSRSNPQFIAPVANPSSIQNNGNYLAFPALADLDGDSDVDLMISEFYGYYANPKTVYQYYENTVTGVGLKEFGDNLKVYPNLVSNEVRIDSESELTRVWISDMNGRELIGLSGNHKSLDLSGLSAGSYLISAELANGGILQTKIIKD